MENSVNERIAQVKAALHLGTNEFALKAGISSGTVWNIENGLNVSPKTLKTIASALNVNLDWLRSGKGKMFLDQSVIDQKNENSNPWKDALVTELKEEVNYLRKLLELAMGKSNFRKALDHTAIPYQMLKKGIESRAYSH